MDNSVSASGQKELLLPRNIKEMDLFADSMKGRTLDLNCLTAQTLESLMKDMVSKLANVKYRRLADLAEDWPIVYPLVEPSGGFGTWVLRSNVEKESTINKIWEWICARFEEEGQLPPQLDDLWLVPTNSLRLRQCVPCPKAQQLLIITKTEPLFGLAKNLGLKDPDMAPPILDTELLPAEAIKLLKKIARSTPRLRIAEVNDLEGLLTWLVAGRKLLSTESDEQKRYIMQHLDKPARNKGSIATRKQEIATQLKILPIFSRVSSEFPFTQRITTMCDLQGSGGFDEVPCSNASLPHHAFAAPENLPLLPEINGVSFYDLREHADKSLVDRLI